MAELINLIMGLGTPLILIAAGFVIGRSREKRHLKSLDEREKQFAYMMQTNSRRIPSNWRVSQAGLVSGQAVIAADAFKSTLAKLRNTFGGEVRSLETLMARARREAVLRMMEEAAQMNANAVFNVRIETSTIGRGTGGKGLCTAEVYAYGTALCVDPQS